jgi:hypothetical protein
LLTRSSFDENAREQVADPYMKTTLESTRTKESGASEAGERAKEAVVRKLLVAVFVRSRRLSCL